MYRPVELYEPAASDPAFHIPILSDPVSLTNLDLYNIEETIFEQDIPTPIRNAPNDAASSALCTGNEFISVVHGNWLLQLQSSASSASIIEDLVVRPENYKVEEPLTPPVPVPIPKSVHFSDFVEEMLLNSSSSPLSNPFCSAHINTILGDAAKTVNEQIEQETLLAADAMGRVEVPVMDFSFSEPPWKISQNAERTRILSIQKSIIKEATGECLPVWPGQKHGQTKLKWNPFSNDLAKMALDESPPAGDCKWRLLLKTPDDDQIIDTSTLTWKPPGLKILIEEDDEEIGGRNFFQSSHSQDILILAKKRRREIDSVKSSLVGTDSTTTPEVALVGPIGARALCESNTPKADGLISVPDAIQNEKTTEQEFGLLMGDEFSAGNALDSFLELRGIKKQKLMNSPHFAKAGQKVLARGLIANSERQNGHVVQSHLRVRSIASLPCPELRLPTAPISLIISSTVLKNRALVKHMESHLPGLKLIERDFTAHNTIAWLPNSVTRSPISSPLDSEADLIVSPTTGIILTTLQKIKQKSLPGQHGKPPIRGRLERVSIRYEKVVVLVHDSRADQNTNGLDESDCNAFSEFVGFASGLRATVLVRLIGGGESTLFQWLAHSIVQYAATESSLLDEETHWELFLRRAGMNAFAAQYISAAVKGPMDIDHQHQADHSGLIAFVQMSRQQRIEKFGDMCGKRLMERVSNCLDARWD